MIKTRNGLEQGSVRNLLYFLCALPVWAITAGATETSRDPETGLESWQVETRGIQVRLTQISPDQARAFYQARGFTPEQAEDYASSCVFMTVVAISAPSRSNTAWPTGVTSPATARLAPSAARLNGMRHGSSTEFPNLPESHLPGPSSP